MKKVLYQLLTISVCLIVVFASTMSLIAHAYPAKVPIICVYGQGTDLGIKNPNGTWNKVYPFGGNGKSVTDTLMGLVEDNSDELIEIFKEAFLTQDWSEFCDFLSDTVADLFKEIKLNEKGEAENGSMSTFSMSDAEIKYNYRYSQSLGAFGLNYDWRLDPYENAETLKEHINHILAVTGSKKYALCGRCEGACVALAYYEKYRDDRITDIILYSGAEKGASPIGEAFSGKFDFSADGIERFIYLNDFGLNVDINEELTLTDKTLRELVTKLNNLYALDIGTFAVQNVYDQIAPSLMPRILLSSYASFPGFWSMVEDKYYEPAKEFLFSGQEDYYAEFIKKIDYYHYTVGVNAEQLLKEARDSGIDVFNIVKYGYQTIPVTEDDNLLSDSVCNINQSTFGTTSAGIGQKLSDGYLADADKNGTLKYISPDREIDTSTDTFRDTTWFIKDLMHTTFPTCANDLVFSIVNADGADVFSIEKYPQYLSYQYDTVVDEETGKEKITNERIVPNDSTQPSLLDEYTKETGTVKRKLKPLLFAVYKITCFAIKIFTPRAKV